jgi:hypothetical protein
MAGRLVYLKGTREDSERKARLVAEPANTADPFRKEETMSEERLEQDEREDEDVEAHRRRHPMRGEDTGSQELLANDDDDSDDVEAHRRRAL